MKKTIWLYFIFVSQLFFAQQNNQLWKGYFSYNEIVDVESATDKVFTATQNAVFLKTLLSSDLTIYNSINWLKPESITTIHHSESSNKTFVGNTNGLLLIINSDGSISTKVDIINEVPVPPNKKKINDFYEHNGRLYISADYGISVVDIATSDFIITYFIGTSGEETEVLQTTVLGDHIYAVTRDFGIRKGNLTNPNLYDFSQWQTFEGGYWLGIVTFNNALIGMNSNSKTYRYNGTAFQEILNQTQPGLKIKTNGTELIVTTANHVYVLNQTFAQLANVTSIPNFNAVFTAATVVGSKLYIGTEKEGLFSTDLSNPTVFENISPNGPVRNYIFRVKKALNYLWTVYGDYTRQYNPYALDEFGISKYSKDYGWELIPYNDIFQAKSVCDLVINPNNQTQIYATSYFSGLLKIQGDAIELFNQANTGSNGLESLVLTPPNPAYVDVRVNSPAFDKDGNLYKSLERKWAMAII